MWKKRDQKSDGTPYPRMDRGRSRDDYTFLKIDLSIPDTARYPVPI